MRVLLKAQPSEAQKEAGNYRKRHIRFQGLNIAIENPNGSVRSGTDRGGKKWSTKMHADYGYVNGSMGVDGDQVDVFIGPDKEVGTVYVITTMAPPDFSKRDENKCMLGYASQAEAKAAFLAHYDSDKFFGGIVAMPMDEFKAKVLATKDRPKFIKAHVSGYRRDDGAYVAPHEDKRPARKPPNRQKRYPNKRGDHDLDTFNALKDGRREALRELAGPKLDSMLVSMHASNKHLRDLVEKASQPAVGIADATLEALSGMDPKRMVRLHGWHDLIGLLRSVLRDFSLQLRKAGAHKQADWLQWKVGEWTDDDIGRLLFRADARGKTMTKGMDMNHIGRLLGDFGGNAPRVLFMKGYVRAHTRIVNGKTVPVPSYHTDVIAGPKPGKRVKDARTGDLFSGQVPAKTPMGPSPYSEAAMRDPEKHTDDLFAAKPMPAAKEVDTDKLADMGRVYIRDVDAENIYFMKDGTRYFVKVGNTDGYKVGEHDFSANSMPKNEIDAEETYQSRLSYLEDRANRFGREKIIEEAKNALLGHSLGREFGESIDDFHARRPDEFARNKATQAWLNGGKPTEMHAMPKQEAIAEHERLVDVLNSPSHADDKVEAKKQAEELAEMKGATMTKSARILFFKSHVDGYTRKDGVTVKPHEDKRTKKVEKDWRDEENWHTRTMGRMKTLSDDSLRYIIKDANEAAHNMEQMNPNSEKAGRYRDEAHYAGMELRKRQEKHKAA